MYLSLFIPTWSPNEGEGNACFSPIWIKMEQSILKIIYIILYIFEIHNKIFNVYNQ